MAGQHTLKETERQVNERLQGMSIDFTALAVTSNLFRAESAMRNHLQRNVLDVHHLSWSAFVVLWVVWIWGEVETREIAQEAGFSKATLTGVLKTLEKRGLASRRGSLIDRRLVNVTLTDSGEELMGELFPRFNAQEQRLAGVLSREEQVVFAEMLRKITVHAQAHND
jgi:DNA-binding MarR family transcriptional regulator